MISSMGVSGHESSLDDAVEDEVDDDVGVDLISLTEEVLSLLGHSRSDDLAGVTLALLSCKGVAVWEVLLFAPFDAHAVCFPFVCLAFFVAVAVAVTFSLTLSGVLTALLLELEIEIELVPTVLTLGLGFGFLAIVPFDLKKKLPKVR